MNGTLAFEDLERAYEQLAQAIDAVGPDNENLFLAKLALALCHKLADPLKISDAIAMAQADLDAQPN